MHQANLNNLILSGGAIENGINTQTSDGWIDVFKTLKGAKQMSGKVHKENVITELKDTNLIRYENRIRQHAANKDEFFGVNIEGHWRRHYACEMDDDNFPYYGIYHERVTFPIFIYDEDADQWVENGEDLNDETKYYKDLCRPYVPNIIKMNTADILLVANGGMLELMTKGQDE
jgi:hypothetical protein